MEQRGKTRKILIAHVRKYPDLEIRDMLKFLHQSALGCEHLVTSPEKATALIRAEFENLSSRDEERIEPLDGAYSRVHLSLLNDGLTPETLGRLFFISAKKESEGISELENKIAVAKALAEEGLLPFALRDFEEALRQWKNDGYPAVRHSESFREKYRPSYRVIANEYIPHLPLFAKIDSALRTQNDLFLPDGYINNPHFRKVLSSLYGDRLSFSQSSTTI